MVDPNQEVEYLNYQDQVHHNVTDGGYDHDHISEQQQRPDEDDIATAAAPAVLLSEPPFPGGPENISLPHSYANHVALPLWYNSDNVIVIFFTFFSLMFNNFLYMCVCLIIILTFICVFLSIFFMFNYFLYIFFILTFIILFMFNYDLNCSCYVFFF